MSGPKILAVIPARLGSQRFPGKVIYPLRGKPLLFYVWREVVKAREISRTVIATDSPEVREAADEFGAEVVMTKGKFQTGSDRVAAVARNLGGSIVLNVQGDNIGLKAGILDRTIRQMRSQRGISVASLMRRIRTEADLDNPNIVKVVVDTDRRALWFSRLPIPHSRSAAADQRLVECRYYAHIGVYFFRGRALEAFARQPRTPAEKAESLEQLRILENGGKIHMFETTMQSVSVDSPEDIKRLAAAHR